ncbi:GNAT family N-acetyltransferase [Cellulomonas fengjieae]|uniref:Lysine N-acyltransferase MbtK n=1 Tax=Cellulomonas fengjieae TaxID=2819978 RepID=A0ABS3SLF1_9CELL|nr:GNAT family N-acetyltransferase [Cellulomonas fengjieae]MBO3086194.1 acetyltransferase [Cellulomonas fengjieae]MBO3102400.1 acetyltransferase [Cellulomonas fengjieae]QVI65752.1 acetyltransferase [Cellulomonas fengjieae]
MSIAILPLDRHRYAPLVHGWLAHPASAFWQMGGLSLDDVRAYLAAVAADPRQDSWLGFVDEEPTFLVETYDPTTVLLDGVPEVRPGDLGMHLLVAPPTGAPVHGFTSGVMAATVAFCFGELGASRVVVEPDVRNHRVAAKNAEVGFRVLRELDLPGKRASLAVCTREAFAESTMTAGSRR